MGNPLQDHRAFINIHAEKKITEMFGATRNAKHSTFGELLIWSDNCTISWFIFAREGRQNVFKYRSGL